jgi:hypothetical protein
MFVARGSSKSRPRAFGEQSQSVRVRCSKALHRRARVRCNLPRPLEQHIPLVQLRLFRDQLEQLAQDPAEPRTWQQAELAHQIVTVDRELADGERGALLNEQPRTRRSEHARQTNRGLEVAGFGPSAFSGD